MLVWHYLVVSIAVDMAGESHQPGLAPRAADETLSCGYLLAVDPESAPVVHDLTREQLRSNIQGPGIVVWASGPGERWQVISGAWKLPASAAARPAAAFLDNASRGPASGGAGPPVARYTAPLEQLAGMSVTRAPGGLLTPAEGETLLGAKPTLRRIAAPTGNALPAAAVILSRDGQIILRAEFAKNQAKLAWNQIGKLPADLREGLSLGEYTVQLEGEPAAIQFQIADRGRRQQVLARPSALAGLLGNRTDALYVQVAVEHLLTCGDSSKRDRGYLTDALDILESVPSAGMTPYLTRLQKHVVACLHDPGQRPLLPSAAGPATGVREIDEARNLIAAGRWTAALGRLAGVPAAGEPDPARARALASLYRAVIWSEAGAGKEEEAESAFRDAIDGLEGGRALDQYRAHNDYANFLTSRAQDRLYGQAFRAATGGSHTVLGLLSDWSKARQNYETALAMAGELGPAEQAAVQVNLARLYALLADMVRSLGTSDDGDRQFAAGEDAAADRSRKYAADALVRAALPAADPLVGAIARETLGHLALRRGDLAECREDAELARKSYLSAGCIEGVESIERLLALCQLQQVRDQNPPDGDRGRQAALQKLLVAQELSELLRQEYPIDRYGLSRAGFYARRVYVHEKIIELLVQQGRDREALYYAEACKARALYDLLGVRGVRGGRVIAEPSDLADMLAHWPADLVALEYFLGNETAWVFVVKSGELNAYPLTRADGQPLDPRRLVADIHNILDDFGSQATKMSRRLLGGQGFDNTWQDRLHDSYARLIPADVAAQLRQARKVIIVPHHILHYFPFAALVTQRDSVPRSAKQVVQPRFLVDEPFDFCYAPSLTSWWSLRLQPDRRIKTANAMGLVDLPGLAPLPGVTLDIENLKTAFGRRVEKVFLGQEADRSQARKLLSQPGLLLLATHGANLPDQPLESYLMLSPRDNDDGRLTAAEIYGTRGASDLVVLNACYSGLADRSPLPGDDLFGLQRALFQGGARTVVAGLWDVYDDTGPPLIREFLQELAQGKPAPAAMALSQRMFLKNLRSSTATEPWLHPYFWAVYTVTGDDRTR